MALEKYLNELLEFVPSVEQSEVLHRYFCFPDLQMWDYDSLTSLGDMIGPGAYLRANRLRLDQAAVEMLPKAKSLARDGSESPVSPSGPCVICQDSMDLRNGAEDVRELPCGHMFHFECISRWLKEERNSCCVCQREVVPLGAQTSESTGSVVNTDDRA